MVLWVTAAFFHAPVNAREIQGIVAAFAVAQEIGYAQKGKCSDVYETVKPEHILAIQKTVLKQKRPDWNCAVLTACFWMEAKKKSVKTAVYEVHFRNWSGPDTDGHAVILFIKDNLACGWFDPVQSKFLEITVEQCKDIILVKG